MAQVVLVTPAVPASHAALEVAARIAEQVHREALHDAESLERAARELLIARLPRSGGWLADHPRLLRLVFRLRPGLRPTVEWRRYGPVDGWHWQLSG